MQLYLSRLCLDHRSRAVMKDVTDPRMLHRTISGCFDSIEGQNDLSHHERKTPRNTFNILHRLERQHDRFVLYVQSTTEPDWSRLTPGYADRIDIKPVDRLYSNIVSGTRLVFRLAANPTKRAGKHDEGHAKFSDKKRRRIDIRDEEGRIRWLERKGSQCGFSVCRVSSQTEVASVNASPRPSSKFRHETGWVTLGSAIFDGVLEVKDPDTFRAAITAGIGTGKAYGFGLLSIAPER